MATQITIQVGDKHYAVDSVFLPPVGTKFTAHKHLFDGGTTPTLVVVAHEWQLDEPVDEKGNASFSVWVKTRVVEA